MSRLTLDRVRQLAATGIRKARPITRTAEKVAGLAVQIRGAVTPLAMVGLASTALNALEDFVTPPPATACDTLIYPVSTATLIAALQADGWAIAETNDELTNLRRGEAAVRVRGYGDVEVLDAATVKAIDHALDRFLPPIVVLSRVEGRWHDAPGEGQRYSTDDGALIADTLRAHAAEGPRCVLLHGEPGTGKTAMTREIIDRLALGRAVVLHPTACLGGVPSPGILRHLSPRVLVVDDVDKLELELHHLEGLRATAPVVILTANNGDVAEVLDGALCRPGRVDEFWRINGPVRPPDPPFDLLPPETWDEVKHWPPAFANELATRLRVRGLAGARLDDLRERLGRAVRSRDFLSEPRSWSDASSPPSPTARPR